MHPNGNKVALSLRSSTSTPRRVILSVMFSMKHIEHIEKQLPDKRKALLHSLREHNWNVVGIDDENSDWALDEKWLIESTREHKGAGLTLWMFKHDGIHDGMDRVVATARDVGGTDSRPELTWPLDKSCSADCRCAQHRR